MEFRFLGFQGLEGKFVAGPDFQDGFPTRSKAHDFADLANNLEPLVLDPVVVFNFFLHYLNLPNEKSGLNFCASLLLSDILPSPVLVSNFRIPFEQQNREIICPDRLSVDFEIPIFVILLISVLLTILLIFPDGGFSPPLISVHN